MKRNISRHEQIDVTDIVWIDILSNIPPLNIWLLNRTAYGGSKPELHMIDGNCTSKAVFVNKNYRQEIKVT